jgi:hypothetical protein
MKDEQFVTLEKLLKTRKIRETPLRRNKINAGDIYCPRKSVLCTLVDAEFMNTNDLSSDYYFSIGSAMHSTFTTFLEELGILYGKEARLESALVGPPRLHPLKGFVDAIIKVNGEVALVEIKSCGATLPVKPKEDHLAQLRVYLMLTGVERGYIVYVSRSVAKFGGEIIQKLFRVEPDNKTYALRVALVSEYANALVVPLIPPYIRSAAQCSWCPFQPYCWQHVKIKLDAGVNEAPTDKVQKSLELKARRVMRSLPGSCGLPELAKPF